MKQVIAEMYSFLSLGGGVGSTLRLAGGEMEQCENTVNIFQIAQHI